MKHVVIAAHPNPKSFTLSVAHRFIDELTRNGHAAELRDLYALDFNPVLSAVELGAQSVAEDVRREQELIAGAGAVSFIYPLWWASMPAILKGYIDRVFTYGFAYKHEGARMRGLLGGKKSVVLTISAAPIAAMERTGDWSAIETLQDSHIFRTCGLEVVEHNHFDEIVPGLAEVKVQEHFARLRPLVQVHFPAA